MAQVLPQATRLLAAACLALLCLAPARAASTDNVPSFAEVVDRVQPKIVKIYGAGGLKGLEFYQSGVLVSAEGHILTAWSYVLDSDVITCTLNDGRKYEAQLIGADPRLEVAVLKIDAEELPYFNLAEAQPGAGGARVLAFSNLFNVAIGNEPSSVLHGVISVVTPLNARAGSYQSPYRGTVYVVDAITNNPGAAGGALTDRRGHLLGLLGKELRNAHNNTWLNYALPIPDLVGSVNDIIAGKVLPRDSDSENKPERPVDLSSLGIVLVPDVLERTPPFIDLVRTGSPAAELGLRSDDLVIFINDRLIQSCQSLRDELQYIEYESELKLTVLRGQDLVEVMIQAK